MQSRYRLDLTLDQVNCVGVVRDFAGGLDSANRSLGGGSECLTGISNIKQGLWNRTAHCVSLIRQVAASQNAQKKMEQPCSP
jgi:hypothetical protein